MADNIVSSEQIDIYEISIGSERFKDNKKLMLAGKENATSVVSELVIYENLYMPYLTGSLLLVDDNDLVRIVGLKGTERLYVSFKTPESTHLIEKVFVISSITRQYKVNENRSLLVLELIEQHGFFNELEVINKSYNGNSIEIVEKILEDNTAISLSEYSKYKVPEMLNGYMRYIVPWQTPYAAIQTVLNFSYTDNAMPYFLHSALTTDGLVLRDLETILESEAFNENLRPFIYSQAAANAASNEFIDTIFTIQSMDASEMSDTLDLVKRGAISSSFETIETTSGNVSNINSIRMFDELESLINDNIIKNANSQTLFIDEKFNDTYNNNRDGTKNKSINDYMSTRIALLTNQPYDNAAGLASSPLSVKKNIVKNNYIKHLANDCIDIVVSGFPFGVRKSDRTVGNKIKIVILKEGGSENDDVIDYKKSGDYIMLAKKHVFNIKSETHNVVIKAGRLTEPVQPRGE